VHLHPGPPDERWRRSRSVAGLARSRRAACAGTDRSIDWGRDLLGSRRDRWGLGTQLGAHL